MKRFSLFMIMAVLLLCSGCTVRYLPASSPDASIIEDAFLYRDADSELVAQNLYWTREPENLNDYFTTFFVTVRNLSSEKLDISKADFALLDAQGNQSDPLDIHQVEEIILNDELQYLVVHKLEDQDEKKFVTIEDQTDHLDDWRKAKSNLISDSFAFGEIYPQAKRTGYIFFPKVNIKNDELTLLYHQAELKFIR